MKSYPQGVSRRKSVLGKLKAPSRSEGTSMVFCLSANAGVWNSWGKGDWTIFERRDVKLSVWSRLQRLPDLIPFSSIFICTCHSYLIWESISNTCWQQWGINYKQNSSQLSQFNRKRGPGSSRFFLQPKGRSNFLWSHD